MTEEQLRNVLASLPFAIDGLAVHSDGRRLIGVVVSTEFEGMDEAERQRIVWHHLHQVFDVQQLTRIEFVFTNTPQEDADLANAMGAP